MTDWVLKISLPLPNLILGTELINDSLRDHVYSLSLRGSGFHFFREIL